MLDEHAELLSEFQESNQKNLATALSLLDAHQITYYTLPREIIDFIRSFTLKLAPKSYLELNSNLGELIFSLDFVEKRHGIVEQPLYYRLTKQIHHNVSFQVIDKELEEEEKEQFDLVFTYPVLGQRLFVNGKKVKSEEFYLLKALKAVSRNGDLLVLVPNKVLALETFGEVRKSLTRNLSLSKVINLPKNWSKFTGVNASLVHLTGKPTDIVGFYQIESLSELSEVDLNSLKPDFETHQLCVGKNLHSKQSFHDSRHSPLQVH